MVRARDSAEESQLIEQPAGRRTRISPSERWPQYRKFSAALSVREITVRALTATVAFAAVATAWTHGEPQRTQAGSHTASYVILPRVEIVAKRQSPVETAKTFSAPSTDSVKFVSDRDSDRP
jgi:hypothetical protein